MEGEGWAWLKDKAASSPPSAAPPPLPGPSPAARAGRPQTSSSTGADAHSEAPPVPPPKPDFSFASTASHPPPAAPQQRPAALSKPTSLPPAVPSTTSSQLQPSSPEVDLVRLAEQTARNAALLQEAIKGRVARSGQSVRPGTAAHEGHTTEIASFRGADRVVFGRRLMPVKGFCICAGYFAEVFGLEALRMLSLVSKSWRDGLRASMFILKSVRATLASGEKRVGHADAAAAPGVAAAAGGKPFPPLASGMNMLKQGLAAIQQPGAQTAKLEELEDVVTALRTEREQLYAQVQADALIKKHQEQKIKDLEGGLSVGGSGAGGGSGCGNCEAVQRKLEEAKEELRRTAEASREEKEAWAKQKKVLVAEVQRLRGLQAGAAGGSEGTGGGGGGGA